ncbi:MAG: cell division protein ZipA C-terminal FtsZ-binding domain-containing protein [Pseudomonadota bacterium]
MSLRITLLIIGLLIIGGIYAFSVIRKRDVRVRYQRSPKPTPRDFTFDRTTDINPPPESAPAAQDQAVTVEGDKDEAFLALPEIRQEPETHGAQIATDDEQLELFKNASSVNQAPATNPAITPAPEDDGLEEPPFVTLYVHAGEGRELTGNDIVGALNAVGMRFGDAEVFHHFGVGDLQCEQSIFTVANSFEPGTFDLEKIDAFRTTGLVFILPFPAPLDGPVAFELLLNTAQRFASLVDGELLSAPQTLLDSQTIATFRARAAAFADGG